MSEALSSSEIEDVLSSIRRLVSDDMRPAPRPAAAQADDKLLLTPALRVVQSEGRQAAGVVPPAIDDVVATVSAGVAQQEDEWESETGDLQPEPPEQVIPPEWMLPEDSIDEAPFAEAEDEVGAVEFLSRRTAAVVIEDPAEEDDHLAEPWAPPEPEAALPGWAQSPDPVEVEADEQEAPQPEAWASAAVEPDRAWADEAEAEVLQELTAAAGPVAMDTDEIVLNPAEREMPINEDVLREIVRDVLREELQGRLGERITRNIRKLVRAEIARALAAEDLM